MAQLKINLIGFAGLPGSGKDTAAILLSMLGFKPNAFANALRDEVQEAYAVDRRSLLTDTWLKEQALEEFALKNCRDGAFLNRMLDLGFTNRYDYRTPRWTMQMWGTEYRRQQKDTYWIDKIESWMRFTSCANKFCITDVRFPNEAELIHKREGKIIRLERAGCIASGHASDKPVDCDFVVENNGSLDELEQKLKAIILE
jgi:hypothetical protein